MEDCLMCTNSRKLRIEGSMIKDVRCYHIMKLGSKRIPLKMWVGLYGDGIKEVINPPKGCPIKEVRK